MGVAASGHKPALIRICSAAASPITPKHPLPKNVPGGPQKLPRQVAVRRQQVQQVGDGGGGAGPRLRRHINLPGRLRLAAAHQAARQPRLVSWVLPPVRALRKSPVVWKARWLGEGGTDSSRLPGRAAGTARQACMHGMLPQRPRRPAPPVRPAVPGRRAPRAPPLRAPCPGSSSAHRRPAPAGQRLVGRQAGSEMQLFAGSGNL